MLESKKMIWFLCLLLAAGFAPKQASGQEAGKSLDFRIEKSVIAEEHDALELHIVGRVIEHRLDDGRLEYERQWPGTYIEAAFRGNQVYFDLGTGPMILAVSVDGGPPVELNRPDPGRYQVSGLSDSAHVIRIEVVNESQGGPTRLGAIYIDQESTALSPPSRDRQFEFIGDSHTVGYANTSDKRDCTGEEVWETTNTSLGIPGQLSRLYHADYQVNAISGRGVVRNYGGGGGATVPQQYPYALVSSSDPYTPQDWSPEIVVFSLGTNDFSTDLNANEVWSTRQELTLAYQDTCIAFLQTIRKRYPDVYIIFWLAAGEQDPIAKAAASVVERLKQSGEGRIVFIPVSGLSMNACHWHPTEADASMVARKIDHFVRSNGVLP